MKRLFVTVENGKMITVSEAEDLEYAQYVIPYDVEALTIKQAQQIFKAVEGDEDYIEFISGVKKEEVWSTALLGYARKTMRIIAIVGELPMSAVEALTDEEVIRFAPNFDLNVLRPLYQFGAYEPEEFNGFDFDGKHFEMPITIADGFGGVMPMAEVTAEEWAESNDLRIASANPAEYMHLIVAILCRPKGEQYNERVVRERAEKFKDLPCKIALDVFFCKLQRMNTIAEFMVEHLDELKAKAKKEERKKRHSGNGNTNYTSQRVVQKEE